jgi:SAM-dependent methyltransferase
MDKHFSKVAEKYNDIRRTDHEPIAHIRNLFSKYERCEALDVGCGPGRYALLLLRMMPQLHLTCLDRNSDMIAETSRLCVVPISIASRPLLRTRPSFPRLELRRRGVHLQCHSPFHRARLLAGDPTCPERGRYALYLYPPSISELDRHLGKYFPDFNTVERRLYSLDGIEAVIRSIPGLALDTIKLFQFDRVSSLEELIEKARAGHYSTFSLYKKEQLEECISEFRENIMRDFSDPGQIRWTDGNVLLIVKMVATPLRRLISSKAT